MAEEEESDDGRHTDPITEPNGVPAVEQVSNGATVVDFDALNAALGASAAAAAAPRGAPVVADSEGRSSATYASTKPHSIPKSKFVADGNVPAVIVDETPRPTDEEEPTIRTARMRPSEHDLPVYTVRMRQSGGVKTVPYTASPSATTPYTAPAVAVEPLGPNARRPSHRPTVVVRKRRPSSVHKVAVFMAFLVVVVAAGIAVLLYFRPSLRLF
jgi:hypothetical protein